jgi:predicted DNA-binding transcriptional regulator AlpA
MQNQELIDKLLKANPNIDITLRATELLAFGESIADRTVKKYIERKDEKVYSRQQVIEKFGICEATLWRWSKLGLIESKKIGNRVFYPESEIKRLTNQKGG